MDLHISPIMPNYGPQEHAGTLFLENTFMLSALVYTVGYGASSVLTRKKWWLATSSPGTGMQIGMYLNCASYLWKQRHSSQGKYAFFRLAYITLLLILETVVVATSMRVLLLMYTDHLDYPGGPLAWFLASAQPFDSTVFASLFLLTSFSDLLVVSTYIQFLHLHSQLYLALALLGHLESYREASRLHRFMCSGSLASLFYG